MQNGDTTSLRRIEKDNMARFSPTRPLTARQQQALILYAKGVTREQASERMICSVKGVDSLRAVGMKKIGAKNVHGVITWALKHAHMSLKEWIGDLKA